jgi:F-type H+-transporting ATPase subunit a
MHASLWAGAIILLLLSFFVVKVPPPHVELSGVPITSTAPRWLTNSFVTTIVVDLILIIVSVLATARMNLLPTGLQNFLEMVVEGLLGLAESVAGDRARQFFPFVATIFLFVLVCNWVGLIPGVGSIGFKSTETSETESGEHALHLGGQLAMADGKLIFVDQATDATLAPLAQAETTTEGATEEKHEAEVIPLFRAPSADLNMTFALAVATIVMVQVWGVRAQGSAYWSKFTNTKGPNIGMRAIAGFVSFLEIISEFSRILAFGFRLFGNIFAGEVVLATMAFLIAFLLPLPFYALEVFVGVIQALVFMMLALVFFTMATISHGHEEHEGNHDTHGNHIHSADDVDDVIPGTLAPEGSH